MKYDEQHAFKVVGGALVVNIKYLKDATLLSEHSTDGTSLTNCLENIIDVVATARGKPAKQLEWYQWCEGEGLFKVELGPKITRDMPNFQITSWIKVSDSLSAFEVLFT